MKKIRIGKDISIAWRILTNGEAVSLEGRDLTLHLVDPLNRKMQIPFTVEDVLLEAKVSGTTQKFLGKYSLTLWENYGKPGQTAVDACNAFELVRTTCMEGGADEGLDTETVELEGDMCVGVKGDDGKSAYQVAVDNGFQGTEEEWLASLKGKKGDRGEAFTYNKFTPEQIAELQRPATEAADSVKELEVTLAANEQERIAAEQERNTTFSQLESQIQQAVERSDAAVSNAETAIESANTAIENVNSAAEAVDGRIKNIETQIDNMETNGNALTSDIAAGKVIVAEAITKKGVPTSTTASFEQMAENIGQIYKGAYDESFKVIIDDTLPSPEVQRVGSAAFPNWLEDNIQNVMLKDGVINYYLDRTNSRKKANGLAANIDGRDGDIMIILPQFWYSIVVTANGMEITYSNVTQTSEGWMESPEIYVGASEGVIETTGGKDYMRSCFNMDASFRGGNGSNWDTLPKSLLGMPRTQKSHEAFRTACVNKTNLGTGKYHQFDYRTYVKLILMFMAVYGTRNIQDTYAGVDLETGEVKRNEDGFKYGGLGRGVVDCGSWWNSFNSQNPFIHTDVSYDLGCMSGIVDYSLNTGTEEEPAVQNLKIPVLWGIANPYGHIYKAIDGITKQVIETNEVKYDRWALFYDPATYVSSGQEGASEVVDIAQVNSGYIKKMNRDFLPVTVGGSESSYWTDQLYSSSTPNNYAVFGSGLASSGGSCGLAFVLTYLGVGDARSNGGGRLCFTPS